MTKLEIAERLGVTVNVVNNTITRMQVPMVGTTPGDRRARVGLYSLEAVAAAMEARASTTICARRCNAEKARITYQAQKEAGKMTLPQAIKTYRTRGYTAGRIAKITGKSMAEIWPLIERMEAK